MSKEEKSGQQELLHNIRHSLAHVLAATVVEMFPKAQLGVGPVIESGFYYDFLLPRPLTPEDLSKLENRMRAIVREKHDFKREDMSFAAATEYFKEKSQPFKVELIHDIEEHGTTVFKDITGGADVAEADKPTGVSLYHTGKFTDLCRGGHVENTSEIDPQSFKLDRVSGAYWRGDQANPQMQRIYGLAFATKEDLEAHVTLLAELEKRDHRVLGPKLGLFLFNEMSPGIPFYQPKGMVVRNELEKFVREASYGPGYSEVKLPQMFDAELWKTSGHWEHYKDDMFVFKVEGRDFALKPMNCPGHMLMFKQGLYSYRDLPLRFAEMTTLFRNELSGALGGLTRVRAFAQDDCHIFLAPDQVADEVAELLQRITNVYKVFGMEVEDVLLSTRPDGSLGTVEEWDGAEAALAQALAKAGWKYEVNAKDGAFYGPKIDMQIRDVLGRKFQLATIQLDFQMPKRFGLEYVDAGGEKKTPVVIHRAILGSFERFFAIIIEQFAGAFPVWLSPVQVKILSIGEGHVPYAQQVQQELEALVPNIRIEIDDRSESIGKKIRDAEMMKTPYMLVLGDKEAADGTVAVRRRGQKEMETISAKEFGEKIDREIKARAS